MVDNNNTLEFLWEMNKSKSGLFDNSINIPDLLNKKYSDSVDTEKEWRSYIDYKFKFMMLPKKNKTDIQKFTSALNERGKGYLREFIDEWKDHEADEYLALQYRLSQIPEHEVRRRWYHDKSDDCDKWITSALVEMNKWITESLEKKWSAIVEDIWKNLNTVPINLREDYILNEVYKRGLQPHINDINDIHSSLSQDPSYLHDGEGLTEQCQKVLEDIEQHFKKSIPIDNEMNPNESDFLAKLSILLTSAIYDEFYDETRLITRFLLYLKEFFNCEVCDYLEVDKSGENIVWRAATVDHSQLSKKYREIIESGNEEEWKREIRRRESYSDGVGISGSVLLLKQKTGRNIWFHIGSNDVDNDPRQSKDHKNAYEKDMYPEVLTDGLIYNFWIFPVYKNSKLTGAFRVVNKNNSSGTLQKGGWDYLSRLRLALIADWFSGYLDAVATQIQSKEDIMVFWLFNKGIEELQEKLQLDWIEKNTLAACLRHLRTVKLRKMEKRNLGCCIIFIKDSKARMLPELDAYPLLEIDSDTTGHHFQGLDVFHDAINPVKGGFVYDERGNLNRVVKLEYEDKGQQKVFKGIDCLTQLTKTYPESVCFILPRGIGNILVFHNGENAADIRVSEIAGEYQFRYPGDIRKMIRKSKPTCDPIVCDIICDTALELSKQGEGGLIILGKVPERQIRLSEQFTIDTTQKIQDLGHEFLVEYVKLDGATFIQQNGFVSHVHATVSTPEYYGDRKIFLDRGARHETGEKLSNISPHSLVIVISENGGISLVKKGKIVTWEGKVAENL